jgi:hypothetical protein
MTSGKRRAMARAALVADRPSGETAGRILNVARGRVGASRDGREATEPKGTSQ